MSREFGFCSGDYVARDIRFIPEGRAIFVGRHGRGKLHVALTDHVFRLMEAKPHLADLQAALFRLFFATLRVAKYDGKIRANGDVLRFYRLETVDSRFFCTFLVCLRAGLGMRRRSSIPHVHLTRRKAPKVLICANTWHGQRRSLASDEDECDQAGLWARLRDQTTLRWEQCEWVGLFGCRDILKCGTFHFRKNVWILEYICRPKRP